MGSCRSEPTVRGTLTDKRMKISLALLFLGTVSATPVGYYLVSPWYALFGNCGQVCVSPPCTCTQPVVIKPPEEVNYECSKEGSFPNRGNECKTYFVCIKDTADGFSVTERYCEPGLAFDTKLGVCNWEDAVTD